MFSYPEPARSSPCLVSSNQAAIPHIIKMDRISTCSFTCLPQGGSPVQSGRGSSVPPMPSVSTGIFIRETAPVQFGSVASVRTGTGLG